VQNQAGSPLLGGTFAATELSQMAQNLSQIWLMQISGAGSPLLAG
jgi:hypothetical protein